MRIDPSLKSVERGFAWSFAGFLIGTISLILAVAVFYLTRRDSQTDLRVIVQDEVNLVQLKEKLPKLKILYEDEDILESQKEIKVLRLSLENEGKTILQNDYDNQRSFGLRFEKSSVLGTTLLEASSDYVQEEYQKALDRPAPATPSTLDSLYLPKLILEDGAYARLKVFLIQDKQAGRTQVTALGKISGMNKIAVEYLETDTLPKETRSPRTPEQIVTVILLAYICFLTAMVLILVGARSRARKKRERLASEFMRQQPDITESQRRIVDAYRSSGLGRNIRLAKILLKGVDVVDLGEFIAEDVGRLQRNPVYLVFRVLFPQRLKDIGVTALLPEIVSRDGMKVSLNPENKEFITKFITFLRGDD